MTPQKPLAARAQITPAGLMFLAITSIGWGFNWPVTKYLLSELPPLTMRGSSGVVGAALLARACWRCLRFCAAKACAFPAKCGFGWCWPPFSTWPAG